MTPRLAAVRTPLVLVVDDVSSNRELIEGHLAERGYEIVEAANGDDALALIDQRQPDLVLLDVMMPRLDGIAVCKRIKDDPRLRLIPVVLITAATDRDTRIRGLEAGADDFLTKPLDGSELLARTRALLRDRELNRRLDATDGVLAAFARAVEARDLYTIHHAERVGGHSAEIGRALGMSDDDISTLRMGGILHDLGKIAIPDRILLKPAPLDEEELSLMRTHSVVGERIAGSLNSVSDLLPIIRHHHERFDGLGYPDHLTRSAIPLGGRIAAVADSWDAMISDRPYRAALPAEAALGELRRGAGTQWDPQIVDVFMTIIERGLTGAEAA